MTIELHSPETPRCAIRNHFRDRSQAPCSRGCRGCCHSYPARTMTTESETCGSSPQEGCSSSLLLFIHWSCTRGNQCYSWSHIPVTSLRAAYAAPLLQVIHRRRSEEADEYSRSYATCDARFNTTRLFFDTHLHIAPPCKPDSGYKGGNITSTGEPWRCQKRR